MSISSGPDSFAARSLSVLRSVGGWVAIHPEQTYVATSIQGLGVCKSTYCRAERRELPAQVAGRRIRLSPLLAAALAAIGLLSACAGDRPLADIRDLTDRGQYEHDLADCQNFAAPVSPGASPETTAFSDATIGLSTPVAVRGSALAVSAERFGTATVSRAAGGRGAEAEVRLVGNCLGGRANLALN